MFHPYYYERRKHKKQKNLLLSVLIAIILLVSLIIFFPNDNATPATEVIQQDTAAVLTETATLKLSTLYACGHQRSRLFPLPKELEKKTKEETAKLHPQWNILRFEEEFLEAEEKLNSVCDNHFLLKLSNNKIIVFQKNNSDKIIMEEKINPSILTNADKEILSSGISVNSEYELLEILESFK